MYFSGCISKNPPDGEGLEVVFYREHSNSYLSLIGKSIGADDAFVELNRSFGITRLVFVPEVDIIQAKPLGVAFIPLKLVQQGPCCVALHIDSIFDS